MATRPTEPERIKARLREFFRENVPDCDPALLDRDHSLLESGVLDSFGVMTLLSFIEEEFRVRIPADQIEPANFETLSTITALVEARLK